MFALEAPIGVESESLQVVARLRIEIDRADRVKRVVPFQIARPEEAQPEPTEAQTPIAISSERSEKLVTLDPEADWFLLPELYRSSLTS